MDVLSRVFIGFKLPQSLTAGLADLQMTLKRKIIADLRWNNPDEFVLTLCPLGELMMDRIAMLPSMIEPAIKGFGPMNLCLEGLSGLPNMVQPRYACINLTGDVAQLTALQASLAKAVLPFTGGMTDAKGFQPHIVLGRLRKEAEPERVALGRGMRLIKEANIGAFTMDHVAIIRNEAADGVSYKEVKTFPL